MLKRFPTSIGEVERALFEVVNRSDTVPLRVPTRAASLGPGGEAALVQLITTWASHQSRPIIHTYAEGPADPQIIDLVRRQYGIVSAIVCAAAKARHLTVDITNEIKSAALDQLRAKNGESLESARSYTNGIAQADDRGVRGRAAELMCVDHLDSPPKVPFYVQDTDGYRTLRDIKGFTQLMNRVFERLVPGYYRRNFGAEFKNAVGAFAYELIGNTHDHARTDLQEVELELSLRGLYARYYEMPADHIMKTAAGFSPLETYFRTLKSSAERHAKLIELSVYDCGPGLAQRWTGRAVTDLSDEEELSAVRKCFEEGATTKRLTNSGGGLPLILSLLAEHHGFLRLRTGRLSLFWAASERENGPEFELSSWKPDGLDRLAPVSGTLVTVLAPLPVMQA